MRSLVALAVLFVVTGCGGQSRVAEPAAPRTSSVVTPTPTPTAAGLRSACDEVPAALPKDSYDWGSLVATINTVSPLSVNGDAATKAALVPFLRATAKLANDLTPANHLAFLSALEDLNAACTSAGSSVLQ